MAQDDFLLVISASPTPQLLSTVSVHLETLRCRTYNYLTGYSLVRPCAPGTAAARRPPQPTQRGAQLDSQHVLLGLPTGGCAGPFRRAAARGAQAEGGPKTCCSAWEEVLSRGCLCALNQGCQCRNDGVDGRQGPAPAPSPCPKVLRAPQFTRRPRGSTSRCPTATTSWFGFSRSAREGGAGKPRAAGSISSIRP